MDDLSLYVGLAGIPLVAALVQWLRSWVTEERLWPAMAMGIGVILNVAILFRPDGGEGVEGILRAVIVGIVVGLAASGLYSTQKTFRPPPN